MPYNLEADSRREGIADTIRCEWAGISYDIGIKKNERT